MPSSTATTSPPEHGHSLRRDSSASAILAGFIAVAISYAGPLLVVLGGRPGGEPAARADRLLGVGDLGGLGADVPDPLLDHPSAGDGGLVDPRRGAADRRTAGLCAGQPAQRGDRGLSGLRVLSALLGITGLFGKLLALIPRPITAAVLAGVLFPFSIKVAQAVIGAPIVAGGLILGYLVGRRFIPRYAVFVAMAVGGVLAVATGSAHALQLRFGITTPVWITRASPGSQSSASRSRWPS